MIFRAAVGRSIVVLVCAALAAPAALATSWIRTVDAVEGQVVVAGQPTLDDRFLVAVRPPAGPGTLLAKINPDGSVLWLRDVPGGFETAHVVEAPDGSVLVAGTLLDVDEDVWVGRLDAAGRFRHQLRLGGAGTERGHSITPTADGGLVVAGETDTWGAGGRDALLVKLDRRGQIVWSRVYGTAGDDDLRAVIELDTGDLVGVGETAGDGLAIRLDANGDVIWSRSYPVATFEDVAPINDSFVALSGQDTVLRLDPSGVVEWKNTYTGVTLESLRPIPVGGFLLAGTSGSSLWFARVSQLGFPEWQHELRAGDIGGSAAGRAIGQLTTDGFFVAGELDTRLVALRVDDSGTLDTLCNPLAAGAVVVSQDGETGAAVGLTPTDATGLELTPTSFGGSHLASATTPICQGLENLTPSEVSPPAAFDSPLVFVDRDTLAWESATPSTAEAFTLYRGDLADVSTDDRLGECIADDLLSNTHDDPAAPPAQTGWFYVVRGRNDNGRGGVGNDTSGARRTTGRPCDAFDTCGELMLSFHCTPLLDSVDADPLGNTIFFLENLDGFGIGSKVRVDGEVVPPCLVGCPYPCIVDNTIEAEPTCGELDD